MNQRLCRPLSRALRSPWLLVFLLALFISFSLNLSTASAASNPLTVTLTSPANNTSAGSRTPLTLSASVTDSATGATISRVEFYNGTTLIGTVTSAPYNLSWIPSQQAGTDTLTAEAYDSAGNVAVSAPVTIQVWIQDPLPPQPITITSPSSGSVYTAPATITLSASIKQTSNPIVSVSFFSGSTLLGTVTSAPYTFTWNGVAAGTYSLTASYIDTFNITETSAAVTVTVTPATTPTPTPTSTPTSGGLITAIDAGGGATGNFVADTDYNTGNAYSDTTTSIQTNGVSNPAPQAVWQTCRWNSAFTYTIPGLVAGATYTVDLDWAELTWTAVGQRKFNVAINGTRVLTSFDVYATAGYKTALQKQFSVAANSSGQIVIAFTQGGADNPFISGIEIYQPSNTTPTPTPTFTPTPTPTVGVTPTSTPTSGGLVTAIDAGGGATGNFVADTDYNTGNAYADTSTAINTNGVSNPAPQGVWQTCRWNSAFTYTLTGLTVGKSYTLRLDWAELTWTATGQRQFNVAINGSQVLANFDVYATGGYKTAIQKTFTVVANANGQIVISFTQGKADNPFISGIELYS
jgi:hypothetical protein